MKTCLRNEKGLPKIGSHVHACRTHKTTPYVIFFAIVFFVKPKETRNKIKGTRAITKQRFILFVFDHSFD